MAEDRYLLVTEGSRGIGAAISKKRIGVPLDIAQSILFLLSDAASYITGTNLRV